MGRLMMLLAAEVAALLLALHRTGTVLPGVGSGSLELGPTLLMAVHLAAVAVAGLVLLGTLHDVIAAAAATRRPGRAGRRVAPRWVQATVNHAASSALVVAILAGGAGPAAAQGPPRQDVAALQVVTPPVAPRQLAPPPTDPAQSPPPTDPAPSPPPITPVTPATPPTAAATAPPLDGSVHADGSHVVAAGENLWVIARAAVSDGLDSAPSDREVHAYWVRLLAANDAGQIASGDPDLIRPGEVLDLPASDAGVAP